MILTYVQTVSDLPPDTLKAWAAFGILCGVGWLAMCLLGPRRH